jgi:hypothetical protein
MPSFMPCRIFDIFNLSDKSKRIASFGLNVLIFAHLFGFLSLLLFLLQDG